MADFAVGAARDLPLNQTASWDGSAASSAIFDWAGGDDFDPAKAKRAFLAYDRSIQDQRGAFKLPFARPIDGTLTAVRAGLNNAASRLSQTDMPQAVKDTARGVIDGYQKRYNAAAPIGVETRDVLAPDAGLIRLELRAAGDDDPLADVPGYDGYISTWNTVDHHGTFFTKGAFKKTIKERAKVAPVLWMHDPALPIGTHESIAEDERGVFVRTRLIAGVQAADEALALLRGGVALGQSFGFRTIRDRAASEADELDFSVAGEWREIPRDEIRAISEVYLYESSPVTFASNEQAKPTAVRQQTTLLASLLAAIAADDLDPSQTRLIDQIAAAWSARAAAGAEPIVLDHHRTRADRDRDLARAAALLKVRFADVLRGA